ncbi:MAG: S-layer homology domain-containing protein, partial [Bacillota bacterium]|nr:S-layer homology domain-containing protein [Bacillota bacterium]
MKKLLSLVLTLALALSLCVPAMAASESMANFQKTATYNNQFSDVSASYWATPSIKLCYEYGFMKGTTPKQFSPTGALTVAEAIVMADRLHEIYTTGQSTLTNGEPWYQTYVDYALENGIVQAGDFTSYTAKATRGQMAYLFSRALPASVLPAINNVQTLPDVTGSTKYSQEIFSLYN